jgi:hypothetical protein
LAFGIWWLLHLHLLQTPLEGKEGRMENTALQPLCTAIATAIFLYTILLKTQLKDKNLNLKIIRKEK